MNIIGLLRHGPTAWNRAKRIQGISDIPLDETSFAAAPWQRLLVEYGPWERVVCSPLSRCRRTCELLLPGGEYEVEADLREQDWGSWAGKTLAEIEERFPGAITHQEKRGWDFTPGEGESRRAVLARSLVAIERLTAGRDGERILIVTHLGVIKMLLNHLHGSLFLPGQSFPVAKRALHLLRRETGKLSILADNIELR
jgi:probable phosphoglycerate mutase